MADLPPPEFVRERTGLRELNRRLSRLDSEVRRLSTENQQLKAAIKALGGP